MDGFGEAVRTRREAAGLSLRALARLAHIDAGHLSRIEAGQRPPTAATADALDRALDADGTLSTCADQLAAPNWTLSNEGWRRADSEALAAALTTEKVTAVNARRLAHEWLIAEPPQVFEVRAGRRIGASTVSKLERRVQQLRELDDHVGGVETDAVTTAEVTATADLLRVAAYTEEVGRRLLVVLPELCQIAGWTASDAGRHAAAERLYLAGVSAGHAGGDRAVAANNLSSWSYQLSNTGKALDAVAVARSAYVGARHAASATTQALLLERVAWASARAGQATAAGRALGQVEEAFDQRKPDGDPAWVYWLSRDEVDIMAGRVWTELARPLRAVPILQRATARYTAETGRETALYLSWLAEALVQAQEVDEGAAAGLSALRLSRQAGSARAADRVEVVHQILAPHRGVAAVEEFEDEFRSL